MSLLTNNENELYIVAVGASAGGLEAIHEFFDNVPDSTNLSFIVIQHLSPDYKIFDIGHHVGLTIQQEFELLVAESESTRQEIVLEHLMKVVPVIVETERLKERVKLNGHFKNLIPPNF